MARLRYSLIAALAITVGMAQQSIAQEKLPPPNPQPQSMKGKEHQEHGPMPNHKDMGKQDHQHGKEPDENPLPDLRKKIALNAAGMSLTELELLGLQNNPTLVQASMQIEAARAKALQARLWPNPTVGYLGDQINQKGTIGEFQGGFFEQEIITAGKRRLSGAKYDQQAQTAEFRAMIQQLRVLTGVREAFFKLIAVDQMLVYRRVLLQNTTEDYRTTLEEHNIGRKDKAEVLLAKNRVSKAKIELQSEENRREMHWRELLAVVGVPNLTATQIRGTLEPDGAPLQWETSLARLIQESPELLVAKSHIAFEELSLKREQVEPIPNITIKGLAGYNAPDRQPVAGVQVNIPIPVWNRNQGNIRMVQADLQRSIADVRRIEFSLQKRLAGEFNKYENAWNWVATYQKENLPNLQEAYEVYLDQYKKRRLPWPDVIRVHREWAEENMRYTEKLLVLRQHEVAILGLLVGSGLTEPASPPPGGHIEVEPQPR